MEHIQGHIFQLQKSIYIILAIKLVKYIKVSSKNIKFIIIDDFLLH